MEDNRHTHNKTINMTVKLNHNRGRMFVGVLEEFPRRPSIRWRVLRVRDKRNLPKNTLNTYSSFFLRKSEMGMFADFHWSLLAVALALFLSFVGCLGCLELEIYTRGVSVEERMSKNTNTCAIH